MTSASRHPRHSDFIAGGRRHWLLADVAERASNLFLLALLRHGFCPGQVDGIADNHQSIIRLQPAPAEVKKDRFGSDSAVRINYKEVRFTSES